MSKKLVRLNESELHQVIEESVRRILEYKLKDGTSVHGNDPDSWGKLARARIKKGIESADETSIGQLKKAAKNSVTASELRKKQKVSESMVNEIGDRVAKELGISPEAGKYALAMKARQQARRQGRHRQADEFQDYGTESFDKEFGNEDFYMDRSSLKPNIGNMEYNSEHTLGEPNTDTYMKRTKSRDVIKNNVLPNMKAYPRQRVRKGLEAFDKVQDYLYKQQE